VVRRPRTLVIVPAYNEESNLAGIIKEIREKASWVDILVVDDGSKDDTAKIARDQGVALVTHAFNLGIGGAVQTGFKIAKMWNYDIAVQIDGDGQHDPAFISRLVKPVVEEKVDISVGSRFLKNKKADGSLIRHIGIHFFSHLTDLITGTRITDCSSGFRALNKSAIELFSDEYPVDFPDAEALIIAHRAGLTIGEVPVPFRRRGGGKSSLYFWRFLWYPIKEGFSILVLLTKRGRSR
jgi:glycosyltransferase involved in cell wall biosynthesis